MTVVLEDLEITGGQAPQGGGIDTSGNLELDDVLIDHDTAVGADGGGFGGAGGAGQGGGIYVAAGMRPLTNCTLSDDTAQGGGGSNYSAGSGGAGQGGGLFNGGTATLADCTVTGNSAAGGSGGPRPLHRWLWRCRSGRRPVQRRHGRAHRLHRQWQLGRGRPRPQRPLPQ